MSHIFITGIGGYLGRTTAARLLEQGFTVSGIGTQLDRPIGLPEAAGYHAVDIRDHDRVSEILIRERVSAVCHFAGIKSIPRCENEPEHCFSVNVGGTAALLLAMRAASVPHMVYASTWAVYDLEAGDNSSLGEESPTRPTSVYATSKRMSEIMIEETHRNGALSQFHILRYGNIIGPGSGQDDNGSFLETMLQVAKNGGEMRLFGTDYDTEDGTAARDFVDVRDVADANVAALAHASSGVYNIGTGVPTTLGKMIDMVKEASGASFEVLKESRRPGDHSSVALNVHAALRDLGWSPKRSLTETIADSVV